MMKILVLGALSTASLYFAQSYPASAIPENLKKNADVVIRKNFTTVQINKIDEIKYQYNTVTTILNKDGIGKAMVFIPYGKGDNISDIKATIYDEKGNKIKSFSKSDFFDVSNNSQSSFYSDNRVMVLPYTSLQYPYTVDFSYSITNENTVFIPDFTPFSLKNISLEESQFRVINKSGIALRSKIYPSLYGYTSVMEAGTNDDKTYIYKNVPAIDEVSLLPNPVKILPKVSFALSKFNLEGKKGNINSWKEFGMWYYNSILQPVSISTPTIKADVVSLNLQGSVEDKIKKLYQHMQSKTRYIFVALGIGGWQPMLPEEVQRKGYGDCKGLTNYMKTLLDEAGISSYYCVINSNPSEISFDPEFPKMGGNHVILAVPTEKGTIWLENTSQQIAFNHLSFSTTNRNVLAIKDSGIEFIQTPDYTAEQNKEVQVLKVKVNEDNSLEGQGKFSYAGAQYDFNLGYVSLAPKERDEMLKKQLSSVDFDKIEMKNFVNDRDKASLEFSMDFRALNFSKKTGDNLIFRAVPFLDHNVYKTDEKRELPFEISLSFSDQYEIEFLAPKNYKIEEVPEDFNLNSEFGEYQIKFLKEGQNLKVLRNIKINKGVYTKEKYNSYINFRKKIQSVDNSKILISKI